MEAIELLEPSCISQGSPEREDRWKGWGAIQSFLTWFWKLEASLSATCKTQCNSGVILSQFKGLRTRGVNGRNLSYRPDK
jgi:hypothetical protein